MVSDGFHLIWMSVDVPVLGRDKRFAAGYEWQPRRAFWPRGSSSEERAKQASQLLGEFRSEWPLPPLRQFERTATGDVALLL